MSIKLPNIGGAWNWHQDYGYWYQNGCLYPDMASAFIALDANKRDNWRLLSWPGKWMSESPRGLTQDGTYRPW